MIKKTRFAPSPTGNLHIGNIRTALIAYCYIKSLNGEFILRMDDTDAARIKQEYVEQIFKDLNWLGIEYDNVFKQSERKKRYDEVFQKLIEQKRIYKCYETAEELDFKRKSLMKRGLPPVYDRESLKNPDNFKGRKPYYRFLVNQSDVISWDDKLRGEISIDLKSTSDPIILRENGLYTYMLPSVIDDIDYNITTIVRGEDHITNTAIQIQMIKAISRSDDNDNEIPEFIHLPLLKITDAKISKRNNDFSIHSLKEKNIEPEVIINYLINLGARFQSCEFRKIKEIVSNFDIKNYSSSAVLANYDDIFSLNCKFLAFLEFDEVKNRLPNNITKDFWDIIKNNLSAISDVKTWHEICNNEKIKTVKTEDKEFIECAALTLPDEMTGNTYKEWADNICNQVERSKKYVNTQIRLILTGVSKGPKLNELFPFINKNVIIIRLKESIK